MPIQYRCRCGQEVVLRPHEGIYLAIGLVVAFTILNSILLLFLWYRMPTELTAVPRPPANPEAPTDPDAGKLPSPDTTPDDSSLVEGDPVGSSDESNEPAVAEGAQAPVTSSAGEGVPSGGSEAGELVRPGEGEITDIRSLGPKVKPLPLPWPPTLPEGLDALTLSAWVDAPPTDERRRAMVLLAAERWGSGWVRGRAVEQLRAEGGPFGPSLRALVEWGDETRLPEALEQNLGVRDFLEAWSENWSGLVRLDGASPVRSSWVESTRDDLSEPEDCVLLVDLSQSMSEEIPVLAKMLRRVVPTMIGAQSGRRWGWIGYRDEVVEKFELTDDGDAFLASLDRWTCSGGGDVPEGVDRALFEALRFESFSWRPKVPRKLLLIGDAPPPYERIAGAKSLLAAAHRSPEAFQLRAIGLLREPKIDRLDVFRDLAEASAGTAILVEPERFGLSVVWSWLTGRSQGSWKGSFFSASNSSRAEPILPGQKPARSPGVIGKPPSQNGL